MATEITPGYDFGVNERPTRETLRLAAERMTITGIPLTSISGLGYGQSQTVTDATSASNLASEGMLWVDARGNLWGLNRYGVVRVRCHGGGWETNRFLMNRGVAWSPPLVPGMGWVLSTSGGLGGSAASNIRWNQMAANQSLPCFGLNHDTVASISTGVTEYRWRMQVVGPARTYQHSAVTVGRNLKWLRYVSSGPGYAGVPSYAAIETAPGAAEFCNLGEAAELTADFPATDPRVYTFGVPMVRKG